MCLWNTDAPGGNKISKSYILTPTHPLGRVMSVKCKEPIGELTVQVWLLYHHPNFKHCTLFVSGTELRTDRQTDGRTNGQTDRQTDDPITRCPRRTFQAGGIKRFENCERHEHREETSEKTKFSTLYIPPLGLRWILIYQSLCTHNK